MRSMFRYREGANVVLMYIPIQYPQFPKLHIKNGRRHRGQGAGQKNRSQPASTIGVPTRFHSSVSSNAGNNQRPRSTPRPNRNGRAKTIRLFHRIARQGSLAIITPRHGGDRYFRSQSRVASHVRRASSGCRKLNTCPAPGTTISSTLRPRFLSARSRRLDSSTGADVSSAP